MGDRFVTTAKAADALGIAAVTLRSWAQSGKVRPALITAGGHYRWDVDQLRRELAELRRVGTDDRP